MANKPIINNVGHQMNLKRDENLQIDPKEHAEFFVNESIELIKDIKPKQINGMLSDRSYVLDHGEYVTLMHYLKTAAKKIQQCESRS